MSALDQTEFLRVVSDCATHSQDALETVHKLIHSIKSKNKEREGIGLLEMKNRELLAYMLEMANFMDRMGAGQSVAKAEGFLRAALHRTVLERIKPLEQKLSAQLDKLIKLSEGREVEACLVPRIDDMEFDDDEEKKDDEDAENADDGRKVKKYIAPKMTAVHYEEEDEETRQQKRSKQRALHSSLINELKQQYSTAPEEFRDVSERQAKKLKDIERYEEENYTRLNMSTKSDRRRIHREKNTNALDKLLDFGAYMARDENKRSRPGFKKPRKTEGKVISSRSAREKDKKQKEKGKQRKINRKSR
ncbi:unnamed protein product [Auanema sp. JU1783]|nr:unnamed protein product [Auanema sp. JU1783]